MTRDRSILFVLQRTGVKDVYGGEKSTIATARALEALGVRTHFVVTAEDDLVGEIRRAGLTCDVVPVDNPFDGLRAATLVEKARRLAAIVGVNRAVARCVRDRNIGVVDASAVPSVLFSVAGARVAGASVIYHCRTASKGLRTRALEELAMLVTHRTVAVSDSLGAQLVGTARRWLRPVLARRVMVVPNGFDFAAFDRFIAENPAEDARRMLGPGRERVSILLVGGVFIDKGQLRFLEQVMPRLAAEVPEVHVDFVGGVKDEAYLAACRAAIARLGLDGHTRIHGYRPQTEVFRHYQACDIVVLPSEREGLPRSGVESQAFARPIVATAVVGTTDAVVDGQTGFLVPNDRLDLMVEPLVRLARDAALRRRMGAAGAAHVRARFTIAQNARAMADLVDELSGISNVPAES